jgi:[ribosomal protein S18]-alanine N-acetyltransferase
MDREKLREIVIDNFGVGDLPEVLSIENDSFTLPWSENLFFHELYSPMSISMVARTEGKIAGYIFARQIIDEGHIHNLAVSKDYRRIGIASELVRDVIDDLRENGCRVIFLEVRDSNEAAKKIYRKFNFEIIGTRKNYYISPVEDAVIMALKLEG